MRVQYPDACRYTSQGDSGTSFSLRNDKSQFSYDNFSSIMEHVVIWVRCSWKVGVLKVGSSPTPSPLSSPPALSSLSFLSCHHHGHRHDDDHHHSCRRHRRRRHRNPLCGSNLCNYHTRIDGCIFWEWLNDGTEAEIQLPLKRSSRFQRLFPNPSWLVWGRASRHQKLATTFPGIDSCL